MATDAVGRGVIEARVQVEGAFRVLYVVLDEAIYVLHVFQKRSRRTRHVDLALARKRFRDLQRWRKRVG